jgi:head-tail adaptor
MTAPGILDAGSLSELRAFTEQAMTATCTVQRRTTVAGAGGAQTTTWANVAGLVDLPCSFRTETADERLAAGATQARETYRVRFRPDDFTAGVTQIEAQDRLVVTHTVAGRSTPLTLAVLGVLLKNADEVTRVVRAERVAPGGS